MIKKVGYQMKHNLQKNLYFSQGNKNTKRIIVNLWMRREKKDATHMDEGMPLVWWRETVNTLLWPFYAKYAIPKNFDLLSLFFFACMKYTIKL